MSTPAVSIVIPTHNRWRILQRCLAAIEQQEFAIEQMEVVVVANGCSDGTETELTRRRFDVPLTVLSHPTAGAAAARNRGAAVASGPILLFIDDDVIPSPGLVGAHLRMHRDGAPRAVVGPCRMAATFESTFLQQALAHFWEHTYAAIADSTHEFTYRDVLTGNLSISTDAFRALGGLDERFRGTGEDYEFGWRLLRAGIPLAYAAEATALHLETTDLSGALQRHRKAGEAAVLMARLHPAARPALIPTRPEGIFFRIAASSPWIGRNAAALGLPLLELSERIRSRRMWSFVYKRLKLYHFWRGVEDAISGSAGVVGPGASRVDLGNSLRETKGS